MSNSVYHINKGINKSIEFKGLKAQYIGYLGGCVVILLIVFTVIYIAGLSIYLCVGFILIAGALIVMKIYRMSHTYGEHGLMKALARKKIPTAVKSRSRKVFLNQKQ